MQIEGASFKNYFFNIFFSLAINSFVQDNIFQCTLDQSYRDVTCNKSDLLVSYVDNVISSPPTG